VRDSHQYLSYEEERGMDRDFEEHQERLARWRDELKGEQPEVTRDNQAACHCYAVGEDEESPDMVFVVSPDGIGRHWFDTVAEALEQFGSDTPVHYVETADE
jgi:hypothetical protein